MNYIGIDIHKQFTVAVVKDEKGNELANGKFSNNEEEFGSFLKDFLPEETKVVIESTSVWEHIYDMLESRGYETTLANPVKTKAIASARIKTDKIDAATLADLHRANLIAESYIAPKEIRELKAKRILNKFIPNSFSPLKQAKSIERITNKKQLTIIVDKIIKNNQKAVQDFKAGQQSALNFLMGQIMRESNRRADYKTSLEILKEKL